MTRFSFFHKWLFLVPLALLPVLLYDLSLHRLAWRHEVHDELIMLVQHGDLYTVARRAALLDTIFARNQALIGWMGLEGVGLLLGLYGGWQWNRSTTLVGWRPWAGVAGLAAGFGLLRVIVVPWLLLPPTLTILPAAAATSDLQALHQRYFPGRVVYVDLWGTMCGPCLQEFRAFGPQLHARYARHPGVGFLYIAQGNAVVWRDQLRTYAPAGLHLLATAAQYERFYRQAVPDPQQPILMPHYLILNAQGQVVVADAKRPSDQAHLYAQLDRYLLDEH